MARKPTARVISAKSSQGVNARTPADIAREAIPLLEKAIFDEFGLKVKMGAELEFYVEKAGDIPKKLKKSKSFVPLGERSDGYSVPLFEKSPFISCLYKDGFATSIGNEHHYEIVFSHQRSQDSAALADAISHTKQKILGKEPLYDPVFNPAPVPAPQHSVSDYFTNPTFSAFVPMPHAVFGEDAGVVSGLHINTSLWDKDGNNIFEDLLPVHYGASLMRNAKDLILQQTMWDVAKSCSLAIAPTQNHWDRYEKNHWDRHKKGFNSEEIAMFTQGAYIENRLPAADSDPSISIMLNLVGLYVGMHKLKIREYKPVEHTEQSIPKPHDLQTAREVFKKETLVKNALNDVGDGIGDTFHDAVLKHFAQSKDQSLAG